MPTSEESEMESASPFNNGDLGAFPDTPRVLDLQR
jgi:hypothetical protein